MDRPVSPGGLSTEIWKHVAERLDMRDRLQLALTSKDLHRTVQPLLDFQGIAAITRAECKLCLDEAEYVRELEHARISGDGRTVLLTPTVRQKARGAFWSRLLPSGLRRAQFQLVWIDVPGGHVERYSDAGLGPRVKRQAVLSHQGSLVMLIEDQTTLVLVRRQQARVVARLPLTRLAGVSEEVAKEHCCLYEPKTSRDDRFIAVPWGSQTQHEVFGLVITDASGVVLRSITLESWAHSMAEWSADGKLVVASEVGSFLIFDPPTFSDASKRRISCDPRGPIPEHGASFMISGDDRIYVSGIECLSASDHLDRLAETFEWTQSFRRHGDVDYIQFALDPNRPWLGGCDQAGRPFFVELQQRKDGRCRPMFEHEGGTLAGGSWPSQETGSVIRMIKLRGPWLICFREKIRKDRASGHLELIVTNVLPFFSSLRLYSFLAEKMQVLKQAELP